ncbi:OB-fold nucleic acid binding domain-containing protein [Tessaracoccus sp. ZS01]|uniref:OB-fold nucleic acid binding domain-containing protein n=1 Tax=Tessaracoccus sp. ZS01 TaxID=1906324 RepID=UPI0009FABA91|nr:OB-fold nucleic acid binding domain-containing protein [Tessaracoccus sp. ZS01]MCG6566453.1 DNA-binding protein [Tessaracoccus sp. ZS01]
MTRTSLRERLRRWVTPIEELEATELIQRAEDSGAQQLARCEPRSRVTLRGEIVSITSDAENGWLQAEVNDGSGTVRLIWMGRSRLECLMPGRHIRVAGRLADEDGNPVIYNPDFEIIP